MVSSASACRQLAVGHAHGDNQTASLSGAFTAKRTAADLKHGFMDR